MVEQAAVGRQRAPPPTSSGAQQVRQRLGEQPRIPWKREEHVGSRAEAEHYLRNQRGGRLHQDSNTTKWMFDKHWLAVYTVQGCVYVIVHWPLAE